MTKEIKKDMEENYDKFQNNYNYFKKKYGKNKDQGKILYLLIVIFNLIGAFANITADSAEEHQY